MSTSGTTSIFDFLVEHKPNKKRYFIMDGDDVIDYVVKVKTKKKTGTRVYKLYHSNGEQWLGNTKGELCLTMYDTGSGVKFKVPDKAFNLSELQYHEFQYIALLYEINVAESGSATSPRIVEDMGDVIISE